MSKASPLPNVPKRPRHLYSVTGPRAGRADWVPPNRGLHLVDIENLMGGPREGEAVLRQRIDDYRTLAPVETGDIVVVAANPRLFPAMSLAWPSAKHLLRGGPNGADLALLEHAQDVAYHAARFDRFVIGSGDGAFAELAAAYLNAGLDVGVVAPEYGLSRALARSATFVRTLPDSPGDLQIA